MKKITREEFDRAMILAQSVSNPQKYTNPIWDHINALQTEIETRGQGMGLGDIHDWLIGQGWDNEDLRDIPDRLLEDIAKLTVPQGFVIPQEEWDKRPWATFAKVCLCTKDMAPHSDRVGDVVGNIPRPIPPKVPRARTREEKIVELCKALNCTPNGSKNFDESWINALCTAAGISLTTMEGV